MTTPPQDPYGRPDPFRKAAPGPQPPYGPPPQGPSPYGQTPYGPSPYGPPQQGQTPYGQTPPGQPPYGQSPYGQPAQGQSPYGQPPYGQPPYGQPGWGGPPPRRRNPVLVIGAVVVGLLLVVGLIAVSTGATDEPGTDVVATPRGTVDATADPDLGGDVSVNVDVGDCIHLDGTEDDASADPVDCGSSESNYKVVGKAPTSSDCVSDVDATYYETEAYDDEEVGALCLDVDWVEGDCFDLSGDDPERVACTAPGLDVAQVGKILQGTSDDTDCDQGGIPYAERNFVVCLDEVATA